MTLRYRRTVTGTMLASGSGDLRAQRDESIAEERGKGKALDPNPSHPSRRCSAYYHCPLLARLPLGSHWGYNLAMSRATVEELTMEE